MIKNYWLWEIDAHSIYTYCSPKVFEMLGYFPEEILGKTLFDLMVPEEKAKLMTLFGQIVYNRKPIIRLENSATNIYNLLENLLEWSRLMRNRMDFTPEKFNLKNKIEACTGVLSENAGKKRIAVEINIPDDLEVVADNHMFDGIIRNLVSNAIKFTPVGGKVTLTTDFGSDQSIKISISDTGIGIPPELISKLFILNEMTCRSGTEGEASSGLGLLLIKEFVEKHGGKIWVESEVDSGSTFCFTIPRSDKTI